MLDILVFCRTSVGWTMSRSGFGHFKQVGFICTSGKICHLTLCRFCLWRTLHLKALRYPEPQWFPSYAKNMLDHWYVWSFSDYLVEQILSRIALNYKILKNGGPMTLWVSSSQIGKGTPPTHTPVQNQSRTWETWEENDKGYIRAVYNQLFFVQLEVERLALHFLSINNLPFAQYSRYQYHSRCIKLGCTTYDLSFRGVRAYRVGTGDLLIQL